MKKKQDEIDLIQNKSLTCHDLSQILSVSSLKKNEWLKPKLMFSMDEININPQ